MGQAGTLSEIIEITAETFEVAYQAWHAELDDSAGFSWADMSGKRLWAQMISKGRLVAGSSADRNPRLPK